MSEQQRKLKTWQGWALFGGAMLIVFCLGLLAASLMERRAEVASIFNNRRFPMKDSIVSLNDSFAADFPREYETWKMTADTTFESESAKGRLGSTPQYGDSLGGIHFLLGIQYSTWSFARY